MGLCIRGGGGKMRKSASRGRTYSFEAAEVQGALKRPSGLLVARPDAPPPPRMHKPMEPAPGPRPPADAEDEDGADRSGEKKRRGGCRLELDEGALSVVGTASLDTLLPGLRSAVAGLSTCATGAAPRPGRIKLRLKLSADGRVTDVRIVSAADPAPRFLKRLRRSVRSWKLKATGAAQVVVVTLRVRKA